MKGNGGFVPIEVTYPARSLDTARTPFVRTLARCNDVCAPPPISNGRFPRDSHFDVLNPHNLSVNLDASAKQCVDNNCESPGNMIRAQFSSRFIGGGLRRFIGTSITDTLAKRTLFTSNRWTSTPASTY
jgi:hypothetical protein